LPSDVTVTQRDDRYYYALGYVRGVLVAVYAEGEDDRHVKKNLVEAYNRQADKLMNF